MSTLEPEQIAAEWTLTAKGYAETAATLTGVYADHALRLAEISEGEAVIDVAAGPRARSLRAAKAGAEVLATDFSSGMIEVLSRRAKEEDLKIRTEIMNGQALTLDDARFDAGFSMFGLMMFPDRGAGFRELYRVIKPGGRAVVGVWSTPEKLEFFSTLMSALTEAVPDFPKPEKPPSWLALTNPEILSGEMAIVGFDEVKVHTIQHRWTFESPEWFWERLETMAPGFNFIFKKLDDKKKASFGEALRESLRSKAVDGVYGLNAEAHLAVGKKTED
jgi:ubiquinone/menaquinone biosynthesis C-methylase UbiE